MTPVRFTAFQGDAALSAFDRRAVARTENKKQKALELHSDLHRTINIHKGEVIVSQATKHCFGCCIPKTAIKLHMFIGANSSRNPR
jgi:hypothetical protein